MDVVTGSGRIEGFRPEPDVVAHLADPPFGHRDDTRLRDVWNRFGDHR